VLTDDRVVDRDIEAIRQLIESNVVMKAVEAEVGPLRMARDMDLAQPDVPYWCRPSPFSLRVPLRREKRAGPSRA
jgi:hypothetical protein